MSIKLTDNQIARILFLINRQFNYISTDPAVYIDNQEFFWAGDMKPQRFDVKLGWSVLNDCFVAWDYKDGSEAQTFIDYCMHHTNVVLLSKVEDNMIWVKWGKWRPLYEYRVKRSVPAIPTQKKVIERVRLNAGFPACIEITLKFD